MAQIIGQGGADGDRELTTTIVARRLTSREAKVAGRLLKAKVVAHALAAMTQLCKTLNRLTRYISMKRQLSDVKALGLCEQPQLRCKGL